MAYDNNFGSNPRPSWDLSPQKLDALTSYVNQGGKDAQSYDDMFDNNIYQVTQTTFYSRPHNMKPRGHTHYRNLTAHSGQTLHPQLQRDSTNAHWKWLPQAARRNGATVRRNSHLRHAIARNSARSGPKNQLQSWGGFSG
jgi:hypothetical protein